jgi:hypothetical protein
MAAVLGSDVSAALAMDLSLIKEEYSPDVLERYIDRCRMTGQYSAMVKILERYAHIFDVGAAQSSKQHPELKSIRAYYWVCIAESIFEANMDYVAAIECVKRAIDIDTDYCDSRILLSRIVLKVTTTLLNQALPMHIDDTWLEVYPEPAQNYLDSKNFVADTVLAAVFQV